MHGQHKREAQMSATSYNRFWRFATGLLKDQLLLAKQLDEQSRWTTPEIAYAQLCVGRPCKGRARMPMPIFFPTNYEARRTNSSL
jgi:hypothetical protein